MYYSHTSETGHTLRRFSSVENYEFALVVAWTLEEQSRELAKEEANLRRHARQKFWLSGTDIVEEYVRRGLETYRERMLPRRLQVVSFHRRQELAEARGRRLVREGRVLGFVVEPINYGQRGAAPLQEATA